MEMLITHYWVLLHQVIDEQAILICISLNNAMCLALEEYAKIMKKLGAYDRSGE
jgi:hypothetical protein